MMYSRLHNPIHINTTPGISSLALFEVYKTAAIFEDFIESLTQMVFELKDQINMDAEKAVFYDNNYVETGWFFDEHNQTAEYIEDGVPEHKHPILVSLHGTTLMNQVDYPNAGPDTRNLSTELRREPYVDDNPIKMDIYTNHFTGHLAQFEMAQSIAHECIHIQQMYPKNIMDYDYSKDTASMGLDLREMKSNGLVIPDGYTDMKRLQTFCMSSLRLFSDVELEPIHTHIEVAVKKHHGYIAQYIMENGITSRDDMLMEFLCGYMYDRDEKNIDKQMVFVDLAFTQIFGYKKLFNEFEREIRDKDYGKILLTIKVFVDHKLLEDKFNIFGNYDIVNQALEDKLVLNAYISKMIKIFMKRYSDRLDYYITELKDTTNKMFKKYGIYKRVDDFLATNRYNKQHVLDSYIFRKHSDAYMNKIFDLREKYSENVLNEDYLYEELIAYIDEMKSWWYRYKDYENVPLYCNINEDAVYSPVLQYKKNIQILEREPMPSIILS